MIILVEQTIGSAGCQVMAIFCSPDVYKGTYKSQAVAIKELKDKDRGEQLFLQEASVMT